MTVVAFAPAISRECRVREREGEASTAELPAVGPSAHGSIDESVDALPADADAAIEMLYHAHWASLVRLATLLTRDASVAEEIVQDAFVALHRRWSRLTERRAAHAYLRTSVVNGSRSALRHRGVTERHRPAGPAEPSGPEERAVQASEDAAVMAALRRISRRQQEVLVLRYYADLSEAEIAQTLGMARGSVKAHAHRGLAALRKELGASVENTVQTAIGNGIDNEAGDGDE